MICDRCKQREAAIEFTTVVGDEKKTLHLCPECSKSESDKQAQETPTVQKVTPTHVAGPKKVNVVIGHLAGTESRKDSCPRCGMTYEEFRKIGRLGCSSCYEAFGPSLRRLLKRIHGSDTHVGRGLEARAEAHQTAPADEPAVEADSGVEELRTALQAAVDAEEYERAAQLRDRIARLRQEQGE